MSTETQIIRIPQANGIVREVTLTREWAAVVRDDPARIDGAPVVQIVDVLPDGTRERVR